MTRQSYDLSYDPPAPVLEVTIINLLAPEPRPAIEKAMLDSGADISTITPKVVRDLGLLPQGGEPVDGNSVPAYYVQFCLGGRQFDVRVVCRAYNEILIGRDILNQMKLILDGPALRFEFRRQGRSDLDSGEAITNC